MSEQVYVAWKYFNYDKFGCFFLLNDLKIMNTSGLHYPNTQLFAKSTQSMWCGKSAFLDTWNISANPKGQNF